MSNSGQYAKNLKQKLTDMLRSEDAYAVKKAVGLISVLDNKNNSVIPQYEDIVTTFNFPILFTYSKVIVQSNNTIGDSLDILNAYNQVKGLQEFWDNIGVPDISGARHG